MASVGKKVRAENELPHLYCVTLGMGFGTLENALVLS